MQTIQNDICCENCIHFPPIGLKKSPCSICDNNNNFKMNKMKTKTPFQTELFATLWIIFWAIAGILTIAFTI